MTSTVPQPAGQFGAEDDEHVDQRGETAKSGLERLLGRLPGILSSKPVIIFGILLFCYLFLFAGIASLLGHPTAVTANTQLILGNYTNVSSSVGAGIAAGAGLTLIRRQRRAHALTIAAHKAALEARAFAEETHRLVHLAMPEQAAALGQSPGRLTPAAPPAATPPPPAPPSPGAHPAAPDTPSAG